MFVLDSSVTAGGVSKIRVHRTRRAFSTWLAAARHPTWNPLGDAQLPPARKTTSAQPRRRVSKFKTLNLTERTSRLERACRTSPHRTRRPKDYSRTKRDRTRQICSTQRELPTTLHRRSRLGGSVFDGFEDLFDDFWVQCRRAMKWNNHPSRAFGVDSMTTFGP